ncbi:MAG: 50S ribosomal protein L10 [candidate division Zixibacteria bacterium]|jgi:large subunit ribosomal protein L10|nr:50S ribosomal protein L10 [candidate division Zixibacteria bacterium]
MPKPDKLEKVAELKKLFEESSSFFVTDYQGLNVAHVTELRRNLRKGHVTYVVAKNTLLKIAAREAGVTDDIRASLEGPTAVAFCYDDPSVPAKILHESYKEREMPRIKVFVVDDHVHAGTEIKRLADLPSREVLLSQVIAAVESPLTAVIGTIDAIMRDLVGTIDALARKRESES